MSFPDEDQARAVIAAARAAPSCPPNQIDLPSVPVYEATARVQAESGADEQDFIVLIVSGAHTRSVTPPPTDDLGAVQLVRHGRHVWVAVDTAFDVAKRDYPRAASDATRRLQTLS